MKYLATLLVAVTIAACGGEPKSVLVRRPTSPTADAAVTAMWAAEVKGVARDGDWVLTRSYYVLADAITVATPGENLSHASILDAEHGTVIEAVGSGVREIPLADLVARNHYVIVVRPSRMTADDQRVALERARTKLGAPYDAAGMFGIDHEDRYYCSELVYWASQTAARSGAREAVVTPADLMKYGEVIYWSGIRTDPQVMALATARGAHPTHMATAP